MKKKYLAILMAALVIAAPMQAMQQNGNQPTGVQDTGNGNGRLAKKCCCCLAKGCGLYWGCCFLTFCFMGSGIMNSNEDSFRSSTEIYGSNAKCNWSPIDKEVVYPGGARMKIFENQVIKDLNNIGTKIRCDAAILEDYRKRQTIMTDAFGRALTKARKQNYKKDKDV